MTVVATIQHHPKRATRIPYLVDRLGGAIVCTDPDPTKEKTNSWTTYRLCLGHAPEEGSLLVVQDDVEPCDNLVEACDMIGRHFPNSLVCLWHGSQPTRGAITYKVEQQKGQRYVQLRAQPWVPLVAALWPAGLARKIAAWSDQNPVRIRNLRADDGVVALYLSAVNRAPVYATIPSLVEHPDLDSIRKKIRARVALNFIGDADPLELNWNPSGYPSALMRARGRAAGPRHVR